MSVRLREHIKRYSTEVYRRTTRDSIKGTWRMVILIQFAVLGAGSLLFGIFTGASTAIDGGSIAPIVTEVTAIETEIWSDMGTSSSPVSRLVYGIFHWITVFSIWLAVAGIRAGYAVPELAYLVKYLADPIIWGLAVLLGLQLIRGVELSYRKWGAEG